VTETSVDKFLGGRVGVRQTLKGFRGGLDAVMLAATIPARSGDEVLELGAGAGTASLCLAARVTGVSVTGVEIDADLVALANENARSNTNDGRVSFVEGDVLDLPRELRRDFAHVFCNPPFHNEQGQVSPEPVKDRALRDAGRFGDWMDIGLKRTISGGTFTAILRADRLSEALAQLPDRGVAVFPLWPRANELSKRVIVQVTKSSRAPSTLMPGLVLHEADGRYTEAADRVLRDGLALDISVSRSG
jgi:tRNA1Val (adenine37-N6)-methyltransferase